MAHDSRHNPPECLPAHSDRLDEIGCRVATAFQECKGVGLPMRSAGSDLYVADIECAFDRQMRYVVGHAERQSLAISLNIKVGGDVGRSQFRFAFATLERGAGFGVKRADQGYRGFQTFFCERCSRKQTLHLHAREQIEAMGDDLGSVGHILFRLHAPELEQQAVAQIGSAYTSRIEGTHSIKSPAHLLHGHFHACLHLQILPHKRQRTCQISVAVKTARYE